MAWDEHETEKESENKQTDEEIERTNLLDDEEDATAFNFMVDETSSTDFDGFVDDESWMIDVDEDANSWETLPEMDVIIANEFAI